MVAANVRRLRLEQTLTREELGLKAGYRPGSARVRVSEVERHCFEPTLAVVDKFADALGVTSAALLTDGAAARQGRRMYPP